MISNIGIYGAGQMGKNLATLFAGHGLNVVLLCRNKAKVEKELALLFRITKKMNHALALENPQIEISDDVNSLAKSDLVIECVSENTEIKLQCLTSLNGIISDDAVVATTTSTKSITELSTALANRQNFVGMHFFNPPTLIDFLEIVCGEHTSPETLNSVTAFLDNHRRRYIMLKKENPGFIVNRALFLMLNESIYELYEGLSSAEEIDLAFKHGLNHPMGPIELCDFIGLDVVLDILQTLYDEYNDTKYRPCYLLKQKVRAGKFGKKTKEGFYTYK